MATKDLPAMATIVKHHEHGQRKLTYIAWSQGTTQFFILGSTENNDFLRNTVDRFVALSPVYVKSTKSLLLKAIAKFHLGILEKEYPYGLFEFGPTLDLIETFLCKITLALCAKR